MPRLISAQIPYVFAIPAAGSWAEHECEAQVTEDNPPPYYDLAACQAKINNDSTNPQVAYLSTLIRTIQKDGGAALAAPEFGGYSFYQWSYPLGKKARALPNVPSPANGDSQSDALGCLAANLPFSDTTTTPLSSACGSAGSSASNGL